MLLLFSETVIHNRPLSCDIKQSCLLGLLINCFLIMSSPKRRIETDVMKLMMTDYEVTLINDCMLEFYVMFRGPKDSSYEGGLWENSC